MGMNESKLDYLDQIAKEVRSGNKDGVGVLSGGEAVYVALAASDVEMLTSMGYSIPGAIGRLGEADIRALVERWEHTRY
ncbi:hypothetical protein LXA47_03870 [Massilia sp. P8910]|uniref:hypothetical protein n=1 Tax=Massilia antarctica TaxID=2765360 RepID=UPI001E454B52|nr:hypothetical protein [Massilia antarctica]MCE3602735.1 hypothetical protein [Massilia antarctica]